jgi:hypothetical protein
MTRSTVEIFFDGNRIASHPRLYGLFFASRNSPLLQNIFPGTGGEN